MTIDIINNRHSFQQICLPIFCFFPSYSTSYFSRPLVPNIDLSDNDENDSTAIPSSVQTSVANSESHQQAMQSYTLAAQAAAVAASGVKSTVSEQEQQSLSSTETLLRNIQSLLTVAADNARQQERQISYEKGKCQAKCAYLCLVFLFLLLVFVLSSRLDLNVYWYGYTVFIRLPYAL